MKILAIETSCDETSAAVLDDDRLLSNVISSQRSHSVFGGVVPENASREHTRNIVNITNEALKKGGTSLNELELVAVTSEPGLIGALLVGLNFGKALATGLDIPLVTVNHIHAHIYSAFLEDEKPEFPFIALIISGGHTMLVLVNSFFEHKVLGTTIDDAAGEAFDKVAKMLGLGYPGGPVIDRLSKEAESYKHKFPVPEIKNHEFAFSFSGLKTSVLYHLREINFEGLNSNEKEKITAGICDSFQNAVTDQLFNTTLKACKSYGVKNIVVCGGVSANSQIKQKFRDIQKKGYKINIPSPEYSTDNAAMIGLTGFLKYNSETHKTLFLENSFTVNARPKIEFKGF